MKTVVTLAASILFASGMAAAQEPATAPAAAPAVDPAKLSYTDDWRVEVNHDAESDGEILFQVTPKGGATQDVKVAIKKGTNENDVARAIKAAFAAQIGTKKYSIEMQDGENVVIERGMGHKDIALVFVSTTVKGIKVSVHRD
jgi:hypothetical protein